MTSPEQYKERLLTKVDELSEEIIRVSDTIFSNPEMSFEEHEAARLITSVLRDNGYRIEMPIAGLETAFSAKTGFGKGAHVGLLCQYDALEGIGHACGHNLISGATVGAALALSSVLGDVPGTIEVIGCPAEESGGGKVIMVDAGCFDHLDAAIMFHGYDETVVKPGYLAVRSFEMRFRGKAAHAGGAPHLGINALSAVHLMFAAINALREHLVDGTRVHGTVSDGGGAPNIVPEFACATIVVRAAEKSYLDKVCERVKNCARGAALQTGTELEITDGMSYANMLNNDVLGRLAEANLERMATKVDAYEKLYFASTDVGDVSLRTPTLYPTISLVGKDILPHSREFLDACEGPMGRKVAIEAAKLLALTAADVLLNPELVTQIRDQFENATQSRI